LFQFCPKRKVSRKRSATAPGSSGPTDRRDSCPDVSPSAAIVTADSLNENTFRQQFDCNTVAIIFSTDFPGETQLSQHREKSVGCRNQGLTVKIRLRSVCFTSEAFVSNRNNECNPDVMPAMHGSFQYQRIRPRSLVITADPTCHPERKLGRVGSCPKIGEWFWGHT
jgi:hypothetical protein